MWLTPAPVIKKSVKPARPNVRTGRSGERAGGRHARTGCVTCKIRHVKCDEEKPSCHQCRKTGRVCDGYPSTTANVISQVSSAIPNLQDTELDLARVDYGFFGSNQERHCFEFFGCVIGKAIKDAFNTTYTHQLIMQAAHSNDAIKHAVVAIGSLGEHLIEMQGPLVRTSRDDHILDFAGLQYLRSVRELQACISGPENQSTELVLACCFLLIVFDFLGGDDSTALVHLSAGMHILQRCYPVALQNRIMHPSVNDSNSPSLVHDLFRIFLLVDLHEAIWLGPSSYHPRPLIPRPTTRLDPPTINALNPTLDEISTLLNYHILCARFIRHSLAIEEHNLDTSVAHFHILAEKHRILYGLEEWLSFVEQYLSSSAEAPSQTITRRISLMKMNYHSILISLSNFLPATPSPPSSIYTTTIESAAATTTDTTTANFSELMSLAHSILDPSTLANRAALLHAVGENAGDFDSRLTSNNSSNIPLFAFVSGAIQPLYLVATECQDTSMCEAAIDMLEARPWREGAWDGAVMARIARRRLRKRADSLLEEHGTIVNKTDL